MSGLSVTKRPPSVQLQSHIVLYRTKIKMSIKMSLFSLVACSLAVVSTAAPSGLAVPLSAPLVAPAAPAVLAAAPAPVVTAYSSQYVARNYNGLAVAPAVVPAAAYVGYPQAYAPAAPYATGPLVEEYLF